ncbi:DUF6252 family protein [Psychroflexus tropicus]|uniref:DUF6252 family protein n=1 Tax=Psychroflexus tropicus TaxID=197345 RepID=UPI00037949B1|nr:DUF6252 family protein [Psychroflexus tropicus]
MKNYIIYIFIALLFTSCDNDDDNSTSNPLDQLPPMTTTGENTIGCLVNGEPFTDSGLMNNFYQFVNGEYFLAINMQRGFSNDFEDASISIRRIEVFEGETYILNMNSIQNDFTGGSAGYVFSNDTDSGEFETNQVYLGSITFTRFDTENQIMSGTFEFQAEEITTGEVVNITNGRFDLTFTN